MDRNRPFNRKGCRPFSQSTRPYIVQPCDAPVFHELFCGYASGRRVVLNYAPPRVPNTLSTPLSIIPLYQLHLHVAEHSRYEDRQVATLETRKSTQRVQNSAKAAVIKEVIRVISKCNKLVELDAGVQNLLSKDFTIVYSFRDKEVLKFNYP